MSKNLNIGLFGFGTVGRGLFELLRDVPMPNVNIRRICVRDKSKDRGVDADLLVHVVDISHPNFEE
ncbi:MAG: hypothetical protein K2I89_07120, partial [Muribaculaceae bacterium]|nr:hypothetical protein [Muribaculaceae bacterium]